MKIKLINIYKLIKEGKLIYIITIRITEKISIINLNLQIPEIYHDLMKAFNFLKANKLSLHHEDNLRINLKSGMKLFFKSLYQLLRNKLESLCEYLNSSLISGFI